MMQTTESTQVVIIGAGVSGLTIGTFLKRSGIECVILERQERDILLERERAGVVEARAVQMFERWGLAEKLLGGPIATTIDYKINGESHIFEIQEDSGVASRFCTQQMLVNNLLREYADTMNGDIRFEVNVEGIRNERQGKSQITYQNAGESHILECNYIIGCDGDRAVSRASIPEGVLTKYSYEYGYAWLAVLVEAPLKGHPIMGVSDYGFIGQLPRGPLRSRYYLQCSLDDKIEEWPDERIWNEIRLRLFDDSIENANVLSKMMVPLRSVVYAPMQYNDLFLVGDAAHLVPPASAKGMNLALYDADVLAQALIKVFQNNDTTALESYSDDVLPHVWTYQDFAVWMTDLMHDAGNAAHYSTFRQMAARARLNTLFTSPAASRLHNEYQWGIVKP